MGEENKNVPTGLEPVVQIPDTSTIQSGIEIKKNDPDHSWLILAIGIVIVAGVMMQGK